MPLFVQWVYEVSAKPGATDIHNFQGTYYMHYRKDHNEEIENFYKKCVLSELKGLLHPIANTLTKKKEDNYEYNVQWIGGNTRC